MNQVNRAWFILRLQSIAELLGGFGTGSVVTGVTTIEDFVDEDPEESDEDGEVSEEEIDEWIREFRQLLPPCATDPSACEMPIV